MPFTRVSVDGIGNYMPFIDLRKQSEVGVIRGRNFSWDVAGVRSDFAARLASANNPIAVFTDYVQSIAIGDSWHVMSGDKVWKFIPSRPGSNVGTWTQIATLTPIQTTEYDTIPENLRAFTSVFVGGFAYVSHWNFGTYRVDIATDTYTRLTTALVPGFPPDTDPVYGITETNGRVIYVTATAVYWSNSNDPEDLVPAIGGAGAQTLGEHISGEPRSVLQVNSGFIIWTTAGSLAGEFVGQQIVFRFFQLTGDNMPLNQAALVTLPDGSHLALTRLGLYRVSDLGKPTQVSPLFCQFLREYLRNKPIEAATLWYSMSDNRVYIALRQANSQYVETYCLDIALDKWGIFSRTHLGLIQYTPDRGPLAYVNTNGVVSYLLSGFDSRKDVENPNEPGSFIGLDSFIELGYVRAENMILSGDSMQELTDLNIYRTSGLSSLEDLNTDEEYFVAGPSTIDEGNLDDSDILDEIVDEGLLANEDAGYSYRVSFISDTLSVDDISGVNFGEAPAFLASQKRLVDSWTGGAYGNYLSVRIIAENPGEFFRCNTMDATLSYSGQILGG